MKTYPEAGHEIYFNVGKSKDPISLVSREKRHYVIEQVPINPAATSLATVYKAYDLKTQQFVVFKTSPASEKSGIESEAITMAMLTSPHFPKYVDFFRSINLPGQTEPAAALISEYIPHPPLEKLMKSCKEHGSSLPLGDIADLIASVSKGLSQLYREGVIVKDLKPEHLLLQGNKLSTLLDLGGANLITDTFDEDNEIITYTPHYASPEQLTSWQNMDQRHYVFVLGTMLYELLTGSWPYGEISDNPNQKEVKEIKAKVIHTQPRPLFANQKIRQAIPFLKVLSLHHTLETALAKNPKKRQLNPTLFAEEVSSILNAPKLSRRTISF